MPLRAGIFGYTEGSVKHDCVCQVFLGLAIGRIVLPGSWDTTSRGDNLPAMTIGVVLLAGLRLIPVPFVGTFVATVTAVFGLGAVIQGPRRWRMRSQAVAFPRY